MGRKAKRYKKEIDGKEEEKRRKKEKEKRCANIYPPQKRVIAFLSLPTPADT